MSSKLRFKEAEFRQKLRQKIESDPALSYRKLQELTGVHYNCTSQWINRGLPHSISQVAALVYFLDMDLSDFIEEEHGYGHQKSLFKGKF